MDAGSVQDHRMHLTGHAIFKLLGLVIFIDCKRRQFDVAVVFGNSPWSGGNQKRAAQFHGMFDTFQNHIPQFRMHVHFNKHRLVVTERFMLQHSHGVIFDVNV